MLIQRRHPADPWEDALAIEAAAQQVMASAPPFTAEVLHASRNIVYSSPPPGVPRGAFSRAEAAGLALQACEATARLHEAGVARLCFDPFHLRVVREGEGARVHWLVPGAPGSGVAELASFADLGLPCALERFDGREHAIAWDMVNVLDVFFSLQPAETRFSGADVAALSRMLARRPEDSPRPPDMAALARMLLPLAQVSVDVARRVAALPVVTSLPRLLLDWDHVVADCEVRLAEAGQGRDRLQVELDLAAAHHQRACRAHASGGLAAALRDAERAVALDDAFLPYQTTLAVLLDALGRVEEAHHVIDTALGRPAAGAHEKRARDWHVPASEVARAHATRGMIALRRGSPADALRDLGRAMELRPTGLHAHGLGAALHALGDLEAAAEAEARSVELCPDDTRYRWALAGTLRKLGRHAEALAQAEAIVAMEMEPGNASHREKLALLRGRRD